MRYQHDRAMTHEELSLWRTEKVRGTQKDAATLLGISVYTYCRMENGTQVIPRSVAVLCHLLRYQNLRTIVGQWHADHPIVKKDRK